MFVCGLSGVFGELVVVAVAFLRSAKPRRGRGGPNLARGGENGLRIGFLLVGGLLVALAFAGGVSFALDFGVGLAFEVGQQILGGAVNQGMVFEGFERVRDIVDAGEICRGVEVFAILSVITIICHEEAPVTEEIIEDRGPRPQLEPEERDAARRLTPEELDAVQARVGKHYRTWFGAVDDMRVWVLEQGVEPETLARTFVHEARKLMKLSVERELKKDWMAGLSSEQRTLERMLKELGDVRDQVGAIAAWNDETYRVLKGTLLELKDCKGTS